MSAIWNWVRSGLLAIVLTGPAERAIARSESSPVTASATLLPVPASIKAMKGRYLAGRHITVALPRGAGPELRELGQQAAAFLAAAWHQPVQVTDRSVRAGAIRLSLDRRSGAEPESYRLVVRPSGIDLNAPSPAGLFYGLQTLRQLAEQSGKSGIAAVTIDDRPRFRWRGLMLDSARHMMPVEYIKRQLDLMARYKFNRFHWHLTDDQGWRIEIKRYPRLTSVGAWRSESPLDHNLDPYVGDHTPYGGFYTQAQIRDVVAYAKARHIEVIPEIDIPGHTVAVLASYPELACKPGPFKVYTTWGVADDILCPSQASIDFITNVLVEVMQLFPSAYIHLGGDEAPTVRWEHSKFVQSLMRRERLPNERAVQGWFLRQIEKSVNAHGRRLIGWEEILDGNASRSAIVMAWHGASGAIRAARTGHDVIMTPTDYAYFDYCQGDPASEPPCIGSYLPLRQIYDFEPVPKGLTPREASHILGGQGNLWTEYLKTPGAVEYMLWPRGLGMAEVLWSPKVSRDWRSFGTRLAAQLATFDRLGVNYRVPEIEGLDHDVLSLEPSTQLTLRTLLPSATIRYTLDGSTPGLQSPIYHGPIRLPLTNAGTVVSARAFVGHRASPVTRARFRRAHLQAAVAMPARTAQGLKRRYFDAAVTTVKALDGLTPKHTDVAAQVGLPDGPLPETFGLVFDGYLRVPADGIYTFGLTSDDGAVLTIGGEKVVDRDGPRGASETRGSVALAAGSHPVTLRYFQGGGGSALRLTVSRNGEAPHEVPAAWWLQP